MAGSSVRRIGLRVAPLACLAGALLLGGCVDYANSEFTTNQEVELRMSQAEDSRVTAIVPQGSPVERLGWVGGECECWLVATPYGAGFVYTRFLDMHLADVNP
jgi:hypothetical protein